VNRRAFLATLSLLPIVDPSAVSAGARLGPIGLQLYTVRAAMARDVEGALARVAALGYEEVEFAGFFGLSPARIRQALSAAGLRAPSAHVPFDEVARDPERVAADLRERGIGWLVAAWIPEELRGDIAAWHRIADQLDRCAGAAKAVGLRFAYHNHDYEFSRVRGTLPYDILLERTDSRIVELEMDVYWLRRGGGDPLAYFARWPGRFPLLHLNDMRADGTMADVGAGVVAWPALLRERARAGVRHAYVEHDDAADPFASARASYAYLTRLRF
jgi:sugar phosphate isomerase/epimerase